MDLIDNFALVDGSLFCQWRGKQAAHPPWWGVEPDLMEVFITRFTFHTCTIMAHTSTIMSKVQYSQWGWPDVHKSWVKLLEIYYIPCGRPIDWRSSCSPKADCLSKHRLELHGNFVTLHTHGVWMYCTVTLPRWCKSHNCRIGFKSWVWFSTEYELEEEWQNW